MGLERVPDLTSISLLVDIAESGSLSRAGQLHRLSQPAASARIQSLERLVGFPVLVRGPRGSQLTAEGALLTEWARQVLSAADVLAAGVTALRDERKGRLRVAASVTVAEHLVPRWLVTLAAARPDTAVHLDVRNSEDVVKAVLAREADLGFVEGPTVPRTMQTRIVGRDTLVIVVAPGHQWARRRRPLPAEELAATRLVAREPASGTRLAYEAALRRFGSPPRPLLELATNSAVKAAVAAGDGAAILSELAVADDVAAGRLVVVDIAGVDLTRRLRAIWPARERLSTPAEDLLRIATRPSSTRVTDRQRPSG